MKIAIIGIGLPGSGKTTVLGELASRSGAAYVCPDDIRLELTGDANDQSRNGQVWEEAYRRIHAEFDANRDVVVVDATNAKQPDRLRLLAHCRLKADEVHAMWFVAPLRVIRERNQGRKRVVPDFNMGFMAGWLEACPPTKAEGFDQLIQFDTSKQ